MEQRATDILCCSVLSMNVLSKHGYHRTGMTNIGSRLSQDCELVREVMASFQLGQECELVREVMASYQLAGPGL